jgi:hypothetical protein
VQAHCASAPAPIRISDERGALLDTGGTGKPPLLGAHPFW